MGYQKLQVGRATEMDGKFSDTEDTVNLNNIAKAGGYTRNSSGTATATTIQITGEDFLKDGIELGDLVVGTAGASRIVAIKGDTITINVGVVPVSSAFNILNQSDEPAVLYVGTVDTTGSPTLKITTMGGDDVTFHNPVQGSFLPVQTKRIFNTGTTDVSNVLALF